MDTLDENEIIEILTTLEGWSYTQNKLSRQFNFTDFKEAMGFVVRVGFEAEAQAHHPTIFWVYNQVRIDLQTHDAENKVTMKDINLAKRLNKIQG